MAPTRLTFAAWSEKFLHDLRRRDTTRDQYKTTIKFAKETFGEKKLHAIGPADVTAMLERIEAEYRSRHKRCDPERRPSEATLAKHLRQLSVVLEAARMVGQISSNPVDRLPKTSKPKARRGAPSYFTDSELARLWPELVDKEPYMSAAKLCATTGMRFGEVAGLVLGDVALLDGEVRLSRQWTAGSEVDTTKGGRPRTIDLVPAAQQVRVVAFPQARGMDEGLLFARAVAQDQNPHLDNAEARELLYEAMERAGIPRVGEGGRKRDWHSLRHSFAGSRSRTARSSSGFRRSSATRRSRSQRTYTAAGHGRRRSRRRRSSPARSPSDRATIGAGRRARWRGTRSALRRPIFGRPTRRVR